LFEKTITNSMELNVIYLSWCVHSRVLYGRRFWKWKKVLEWNHYRYLQ